MSEVREGGPSGTFVTFCSSGLCTGITRIGCSGFDLVQAEGQAVHVLGGRHVTDVSDGGVRRLAEGIAQVPCCTL